MTYNEVVEKMKAHATFMLKDISAEQLFKLYQERYMKYVNHHGCEYELNIVPLNEESHIYDLIKSTDNYLTFVSLIEKYIQNTKEHKRSFVIIEHKEYEIILELMVSNE